MRRLALQSSLALDHKPRWKQALQHAAKHCKGELHVGQTSGLGDEERTQPRNQQNALWHPGVVISNTLATVWIAYRGSVVKCARSQVRPFHDDDEAAHEHVTEHMRDLGERRLHEGDFSYEDITGQDEPPVESPPAQRENTGTRPPGPDGEGHMDVDPEARRRMRGKTRLISLEQPTGSPRSMQALMQHQRQKEIMMTREEESMNLFHQSPQLLKTTSQPLSPVPFDSETRNDEIAVDVPLPEGPTEMSGKNGLGWITEEAFFTVSPGARLVRQPQGGKDEPIVTCRGT